MAGACSPGWPAPELTGIAGPPSSAEPALEAVASVRADFILTPVARVLPGLASQRLRTRARNRRSLRPRRADGHSRLPTPRLDNVTIGHYDGGRQEFCRLVHR